MGCDTLTHFCEAPPCSDGKLDGQETDVDCGGPTCSPCAVGEKCLVNSDCASMACDSVTLMCDTSHCVDGHKDADETDVDCGGPTCPHCAVGKQCLVDTDCVNNACDVVNHVCT
jgi:hypothetical protein